MREIQVNDIYRWKYSGNEIKILEIIGKDEYHIKYIKGNDLEERRWSLNRELEEDEIFLVSEEVKEIKSLYDIY